MIRLTPEQAALARDDLDQLHGKGRWAGDASNWCLHDGVFASSIVTRYNCASMSKLVDAVDDAYQGQPPYRCWTTEFGDCGRPALPGKTVCPRHNMEQQIISERPVVPQAAATEMLTETCDIDKFLEEIVDTAGREGTSTRLVMREIKAKVHVSMHGYAIVYILENEWLRM